MSVKQPQIRWGRPEGERIQFLVNNYPHMSAKDLTKAFNAKFGVEVSEAAVGFQLHRFRILKKGERAERQTTSTR
jgi:uncharacterized protein (DUF2249 family)